MMFSPKRLFTFLGCVTLVLCTFCALTSHARLPQKEQPTTKSTWPEPHPYEVGAGIQGLASGSTDIIVADVLKTSPDSAEEGARDNLKLKVVRVLMGQPVADETLDLYYHLLWTDEKMQTLESPKFENGKRYVVFLRSHTSIRPDQSKTVEYELSDQWLSVMPERPHQAEEIAAAIRVAHGDARSAWSEPVGPLTGRLVAYRNNPINETPVISFYLDLRNVAGGGNTIAVDLSRAAFTWAVTDEDGKPVTPAAQPGERPKALVDQRIDLEAGGSARLPLSQTDGEITKGRSGYLSLVPGKAWSFEQSHKHTYFLSCSMEIPFSGENIWYGTLELRRVAIPID